MTAYIPSDRLLQTLRVSCPGATDDLLYLQLFNIADEFFRATNAWRYEDEIILQENIFEYPYSIPPNSVVVRVMGVTHRGIPVAPLQQSGITLNSVGTLVPELTFPDGDASFEPTTSDLVGDTFSYAIYRPDYISVTTLPDEEARLYPMKVILALSIGKNSLENDPADWDLPDWMFDTYFAALLDGTLSRMFMMPAKPWTSERLAIYHGKRFRNKMAFSRQEASRGFNYGVPAWRFPGSGGGIRR